MQFCFYVGIQLDEQLYIKNFFDLSDQGEEIIISSPSHQFLWNILLDYSRPDITLSSADTNVHWDFIRNPLCKYEIN